MDMIIGRSTRYAGFLLRNTSFEVSKVSLGLSRCLCYCDARRQNVSTHQANLVRNIIPVSRHLRTNYIDSGNVLPDFLVRYKTSYSTDSSKQSDNDSPESKAPVKQTIFQKMKQMTKDYWHILIPVHVVTSIGWISIFYAAAKNGVNIVSILESMNLSERYLDILRGSNAGHWAVAYALYKLFTPIRYTVTVGGTTMSIRYLNKWGYLKFKPRSTIKETQSKECAAESRENFAKAGFKNQQQTEPPKT